MHAIISSGSSSSISISSVKVYKDGAVPPPHPQEKNSWKNVTAYTVLSKWIPNVLADLHCFQKNQLILQENLREDAMVLLWRHIGYVTWRYALYEIFAKSSEWVGFCRGTVQRLWQPRCGLRRQPRASGKATGNVDMQWFGCTFLKTLATNCMMASVVHTSAWMSYKFQAE